MELQQTEVVEVKGDNSCACPFCGEEVKYPEKATGQSKFKIQRAMSLQGDDVFKILSAIAACLEELYKEYITVGYHSLRLRCESCDLQLFRVSNKWFTKIGMKELGQFEVIKKAVTNRLSQTDKQDNLMRLQNIKIECK